MLKKGQAGTIRVLLIENHQLILWGLQELINGRRPSMEVVGVAGTQEEAMAQATHSSPHIVLLKYQIVDVEELTALSQFFASRGCRTLLFAENVTEEMLQVTLQTGAHGLLTNESRAGEIVKAIEKTHQGELWFGRNAAGIVLNAFRAPRAHPQGAQAEDILALLTPRECRILQAVVENTAHTNKGLAKQLYISTSTLRNHLSSIYQKLGVSNRLDLYVYARNHGLSVVAIGRYSVERHDHRRKRAGGQAA